MDDLFTGLRELLVWIIMGAVTGVWWLVRKVFSHDAAFVHLRQGHEAAFALMKQEIAHNREITKEIRDDVKSLLDERRGL